MINKKKLEQLKNTYPIATHYLMSVDLGIMTYEEALEEMVQHFASKIELINKITRTPIYNPKPHSQKT